MILRFLVTSGNPAKINAVKKALLKFYKKDDFKVISFPSISKVSSLPKSDDECILGSKNRIKYAIKNFKDISSIDYVVGVEGGIDYREKTMFMVSWVSIYCLESKKIAIGASPKITLPKFTYKDINNGKHLSQALRCLADCDDFKTKNGAFGILTKNLLTRSDSTGLAFLCAYSVFANSDLYLKK